MMDSGIHSLIRFANRNTRLQPQSLTFKLNPCCRNGLVCPILDRGLFGFRSGVKLAFPFILFCKQSPLKFLAVVLGDVSSSGTIALGQGHRTGPEHRTDSGHRTGSAQKKNTGPRKPEPVRGPEPVTWVIFVPHKKNQYIMVVTWNVTSRGPSRWLRFCKVLFFFCPGRARNDIWTRNGH